MRKSYLFLGVYTKSWAAADFDPAIALCKATGITGLLVKAYEHTQGLWYSGNFDVIYKRITGAGLECVPYGFHYGGANLQEEAQVGLSFMRKYSIYCMDAEADFDGKTAWGQQLAGVWKGHPGSLWVSTWANPQDHNWLGIIEALKGEVQAWMPQVYSDKLAPMALAQWPHTLVIQPTIGIVGDGDSNHPERLVNLFGQGDLSIWEYQEAITHMNPLATILRAFRGAAVPQPPTPQSGGASVSTLVDFPMVAERTPITSDGHPPENAGLSCVPASILAGVMHLLGIKQLGGKFTPDSLKDAVYGQGTVGGESPSAYVPYLKSEFGIALTSFGGTPAAMVAEAHRQIAAGHPVVFTIPNPYGNPNYTHVCVFYGTGQRTLTAMDPWIARPVTKSDASWAGLLQYNEIWILSKGDEMTPLTINDARQYFTANPDGSWTRIGKDSKPVLDSLNKPIVLKGAMKDDWCAHGTLALSDIGLPTGNETPVDSAHPEVVDQQFERCIRSYDPGHVKDSPPHAGPIYSLHIEPLYSAQNELGMALGELSATQKQLATAQMELQVGGPGSQSAYIAAVQAAKPHVQALSDILAPLAVDPAAASKGVS